MSSKLNFWRERWKNVFLRKLFNISGNFYSELLRFLRFISEIFRRILSAKKVFLFILFKYIWSWYNFTVLQQSKKKLENFEKNLEIFFYDKSRNEFCGLQII